MSVNRRRTTRPSSIPKDAAYGEKPDRLYSILRDQIIRGRLAPGARLVETELARRFAVSRTPVREALVRLVRESYVVASGEERRTRFTVTPIDPEQVPELWRLIGALEGMAIETVGTWRKAERAVLVADLERINRDLERAAQAQPRDVDALGELMSAFHNCFMDRCAGPWLQDLYEGVRHHVQRYEWFYGADADATYAPSVAEHAGIIAAVAGGDGAEAKLQVERHWARGAKRTVARIRN